MKRKRHYLPVMKCEACGAPTYAERYSPDWRACVWACSDEHAQIAGKARQAKRLALEEEKDRAT